MLGHFIPKNVTRSFCMLGLLFSAVSNIIVVQLVMVPLILSNK